VRFWDSSALLPLMVKEAASESTRSLLETDSGIAIWWATPVECVSALARKEREGILDISAMKQALGTLDVIAARSVCVAASEAVRQDARKFLRRHPLRAAGSLQLAAASLIAGGETKDWGFVCNDGRLCEAAAKEGFDVVTP